MAGNLHGLHRGAIRMWHVRKSPRPAVLAILHEEIDMPTDRIVRSPSVFKQGKTWHRTAWTREATKEV